MQSEMGFPSSHQLKSYVASKSRLKLAARAVLSADAGLLVDVSFLSTGQEIGWEEHLRNDLFCVEWDAKPQLNQSINQIRHFMIHQWIRREVDIRLYLSHGSMLK